MGQQLPPPPLKVPLVNAQGELPDVWQRFFLSNASAGQPIVETVALIGAQANLGVAPGCALLRCTNAALLTIGGLSAGSTPPMLVIVARVAQVDLANEDAGSLAPNRILTGTGATITLAAGVGAATLVYDPISARWIVVSVR